MRYLFTYKNGKKALGLSTTNRGLAFRVGSTTVYPLLVSTSAANASCVRMKVNNEIRSIAYVPSLVIPGLLCSKMGTNYIDPVGVDFTNAYFYECIYDRKYGHYIASSNYSGQGGDNLKKIAISADGYNWVTKGIGGSSVGYYEGWATANTKKGAIVFSPHLTFPSSSTQRITIEGKVYYPTANGIQSDLLYSWMFWDNIPDNYNLKEYVIKIATDGENNVIVHLYGRYEAYGQTRYDQAFYHINLNTNVVTPISFYYGDPSVDKITNLWFNKITNTFYYKQGAGTYYSSDGLNYSHTAEDINVSYGNLNGMEVFSNGLSQDGINISQSYSYRPNAYDPIEKKYIRIETTWPSTGGRISYIELYESTDLQSWNRVLKKQSETFIAPEELQIVDTNGFACVQGF